MTTKARRPKATAGDPADVPGLRVFEIPTDEVVENPRNPRRITEEHVDRMAALLREFKLRAPVLVSTTEAPYMLEDGHLRLRAAKKLGLPTIPAVDCSDLTKQQMRALRLAMNKTAEWVPWDMELLQGDLHELGNDGFDLTLTGFEDLELADLLADRTSGNTDPDDAPDPPTNPVTVLGDVWVMGRHRLVCGDSTTVEAVDLALNGVKPHLMVTDPPYGVSYDPGWRNHAARKWPNGMGTRGTIGGTALGKVTNDDQADWGGAYVLFPGDVAYVWHPAGAKQVEFYNSLQSAGFEVRMQIIWAKNHAPIGRGHYHVRHEPCWYAVRKGKTAHWAGDRKQNTVWEIDKPRKSETGHGTQKPVECMRRPIENNSSPGQAVYEPFSGSGTTIIAAEMTGRCCHAIELAPEYVDVAVRRWQEFTGEEAVLEQTGQTFAEVAVGRGIVLPDGPVATDAADGVDHPELNR